MLINYIYVNKKKILILVILSYSIYLDNTFTKIFGHLCIYCVNKDLISLEEEILTMSTHKQYMFSKTFLTSEMQISEIVLKAHFQRFTLSFKIMYPWELDTSMQISYFPIQVSAQLVEIRCGIKTLNGNFLEQRAKSK